MRLQVAVARIAAAMLSVAIGGPAFGQSRNLYLFGGVGGSSTARYGTERTSMGGLGYEHIFQKTFGIAGEFGAIGSSGDAFVVLSVNGSYHWSREGRGKLDPFVTGGYSLASGDGSANLVNFGGGVSWWFRSRYGLRVEVRDHVGRFQAPWHYWGLRIGLAIR